MCAPLRTSLEVVRGDPPFSVTLVISCPGPPSNGSPAPAPTLEDLAAPPANSGVPSWAHVAPHHRIGGRGGLPPPWVTNAHTHRHTHTHCHNLTCPPSFSLSLSPSLSCEVLGHMEKPAGEKDMGGWTAAVYTEEQQQKLRVDENGAPSAT